MGGEVEVVRAFLRAIENCDREALVRLLDPEMTRTEHPNRVAPSGRVQSLAETLDGFEKGRALLSRQGYEIASAVAADGRVAVQMIWRGTLAIPLGTLEAGDEMVARCALFAEVRDGRIVAIDNYDCFTPF